MHIITTQIAKNKYSFCVRKSCSTTSSIYIHIVDDMKTRRYDMWLWKKATVFNLQSSRQNDLCIDNRMEMLFTKKIRRQ